MLRAPHTSPLFPYTTLFRSVFAGSFDRFYTGGGLTDLRNIQHKALAGTVPDSIYLGVAKVVEAYMIGTARSEEHTSELQSRPHLVCRLLLEKKKPLHRRAAR